MHYCTAKIGKPVPVANRIFAAIGTPSIALIQPTGEPWEEVRRRPSGKLVAGKFPKVALVACMRTLLTTLNAMVRTRKPWGKSLHRA